MNALKLSAWSVGIMTFQFLVCGAVFYATGGDFFITAATAFTVIGAAGAVAAITAVIGAGGIVRATTVAAVVIAALVVAALAVFAAVVVAGAVNAFAFAALAVNAFAFAALAVGAAATAVVIAKDKGAKGAHEPFFVLFLAALPGTNAIVLATCLIGKLNSRSATV